jgi:hypothetical protein
VAKSRVGREVRPATRDRYRRLQSHSAAGAAGHRAVSITLLGDRLGDHPDGPLSDLGRLSPLGRALAVLCHASMFCQTLESQRNAGRFRAVHGGRVARAIGR